MLTDPSTHLHNDVVRHARNLQLLLDGLTDLRIHLHTQQPKETHTTPRVIVLSFIFFTEGMFTSRKSFNVLLKMPSEILLQFSSASSALSKGFASTQKHNPYDKCFQFHKLVESVEIRKTLLNLQTNETNQKFTCFVSPAISSFSRTSYREYPEGYTSTRIESETLPSAGSLFSVLIQIL